MKTSKLLVALAMTAVIVLAGCGGGGGGSNPPPGNPNLSIVPPSSVPDGMVGSPYSLQFTSRGGTGTIRWSLNYGPAELTIDGTGKISGTPAQPGAFGISVRAQDSGAVPQSFDYYFEVFISSPMQMVGTPDEAIRAFPYSWSGSIMGGKPPFTASVASGTLPTGIAMTIQGSSLRFAGTPSEAGTYSFTVRIQDSASTRQTLDQQYTVKVTFVLKITSTGLKSGVVGRGYSDTVQFVNGTAPFTWAITSAGSGFSIDGNGTVAGTPSDSGWRTIQVKVTDSSNPQQSDQTWLPFTIYDVLRVGIPMTTITTHVNDWVGYSIYAYGGVPPVTATLASGTVPPGLSFNDSTLAGYPTTAGTWNLGLRYADSATPAQTYDHPVTVTVLPPLPQILTNPPTPLVGEPYSFQMGAGRGTPPYKWDISVGVLPGGLSLAQSGLLSGTPVAGGRYSAIFRVTDSATPPQSAEYPVNFQLLPKPLGRNDSPATAATVSIWGSTTASLSPYEEPVGTAAPDTDFYKLYATAGSEVTVALVSYFQALDPVLEIVDANGVRYTTCNDPADDNPVAPIVRDATPTAFDDECLNDDIDIGANRNSRLVFKVPGEAGKLTTFYAHALDLNGNARPDMYYYLTVNGASEPLLITSGANIQLVKGLPYQDQLSASGGTSPVAWAVVSGNLPAGMSLSSSGTLSGTPTASGNSAFTVTATDSSSPPMTATKTFGITVTNAMSITTTTLPAGQTGVPYTGSLTWSGGTAPFVVSVWGLPPGVGVDARTGAFSGSPTETGAYSLWFGLNDANGQYATRDLTLTVGTGPLYVATTTLPNATKNAIYSAMVAGAGGKQPYAWQITSGALPPGMALNASTGEVRGIPTSSGVYSFTVKVTDANAATATATLQLTVQ